MRELFTLPATVETILIRNINYKVFCCLGTSFDIHHNIKCHLKNPIMSSTHRLFIEWSWCKHKDDACRIFPISSSKICGAKYDMF